MTRTTEPGARQDVLTSRPAREGRWPFAVFALAVVALILVSPARHTGDSNEYVAMANALADGRSPMMPGWTPTAGHGGPAPAPWHFWFFPLCVSPFVMAARLLGLDAIWGFRLFNASLLLLTFRLIQRRRGTLAAVFVGLGPALWWVDKAQVETATICSIAAGVSLLPAAGWWAAIALAAGATQNPPLVLLAGLAAVMAWKGNHAGRIPVRPLAIAGALCLLHPLYYLATIGRPTTLVSSQDLVVPSIGFLLVPLTDLNVGLIANAPFAAAIVLLAVARSAGALVRRRPATAEGVFVLVAALWLLFAFAQAPNVNSGGTPGVSRYAIWFVPLAIPLLASDLSRRARRILIAGTVCSVCWTLICFRPDVAEGYLTPTRIASFTWSRHPSLENPPPEVFAERLRHQDGVNTLAATPDCAKVLVQEGAWPPACAARPLPAPCGQARALCYANRRRDGTYDAVPVSRRPGIRLFASTPRR